jgi:hypothetical protein
MHARAAVMPLAKCRVDTADERKTMATTTKQTTKPQAVPTVSEAERVLGDLEKRKAGLLEQRAADDRALNACSYQAHAHGAKEALAELDRVTENILRRDTALKSINAAIVEAAERVKAAQAIEAQAAHREIAKELLARAASLTTLAQTLDDANAVRVEASRAIAEELTQMRSLAHEIGLHAPSHEQYLALGSRAEQTVTMATPWAREIGEHLPPNQRRTHVSYLVQWSDAITQAARAVMGDTKQKAA